jgi:hypothetical protein
MVVVSDNIGFGSNKFASQKLENPCVANLERDAIRLNRHRALALLNERRLA